MTKLLRLKPASLLLAAMILLLAFGTMSFAQGQRYKSSNAWSFGVQGDTQWTLESDLAHNPEYVSVSVINGINQQMISNNVRFVLQVGDLTDRAGDAGLASRAAAAQPLFDAGIGFFPLRGNHETYGPLYGRDPDNNLNIPAFKTNFPQTQGLGSNLFGAANFSSPSSTNDILKGLSYAFDYGNASFVVVDVEQTANSLQTAPNNPASCVTAITTGFTVGGIAYGGAPAGTSCGQGYYYILSSLGNPAEGNLGYKTGFIVFKADQDIPHGVTNTFDSAGNQTASNVQIAIPAGTWFRIDSSKRPSTNFYAWDIQNPDQLYLGQPFDIYDVIEDADNRVLTQNSSANTEYWPGAQQTWIDGRLNKNARATAHAFVFSHRPMIGANHVDGFFGADPTVTPSVQNAYIASLANNDVKYMISAHDHIYNRALVSSPDNQSRVEQIISIGASSKFYTPAALSSFPAGVKAREIQLSQETNTIGYYIYTVDGPRVTVDYYSTVFPAGITGFSDIYPYGDAFSAIYPLGITPPLSFVKKESFGYSLNGRQFLVEQGDPYTVVQDQFNGATAKIIAGVNNSIDLDGNDRPFVKAVNTGWTKRPRSGAYYLDSDIFSLWGMEDFGTGQTDTYVLSITHDWYSKSHNGQDGIVALNADGRWVNAVDLNIGSGVKRFVYGAYNPNYGLGTYGYDRATKTSWAVLDYNADFGAGYFPVELRPARLASDRSKTPR
jgi:hypothetical protein